MAKAKKKSKHAAADRFYGYLTAHRGEVLRYMTAALVTYIIQWIVQHFLPGGNLLPFAIRFFLLFYIAKYWVYREYRTGPFYTGRQLMIAVMLITLLTWVWYWLIPYLAAFFIYARVVTYVMLALLEILYFLLYQFIIFKES